MLQERVDNIGNKDILLIQYPRDEYECEELQDILHATDQIFPNHHLLLLPNDITFSFIQKGNEFL